jgi:trigger factor
VAFDAVVEVRPTVAIPGYEGLQITLERPDATPEELSRQIDRLRNNDAVLTEVTRPAADGDNVTINLATTRAGEPVDGLTADDFLYEVGSEAVVPELDQHLRGAGVGDILKFSATVPNGEVLELEVLVKDVKEKVLPEITDEWAGEASEFSTVAELEDDLRTRIETIKRAQVGMQLRDHALAALVELVADDPPEALVEAEVERRLHDMAHRLQTQGATLEQYLEATGTDSQALLGELRTGAVESVKADLALRAICEAEGLEDEEADVEAEIARLAESVGRSAAQVRRNLVSADQMPAVRSDVRKAKALSWLIDHVSVVDPQGQPIDRADLEPRPAVTEASTEATADTEAEDHGAEAIPEETKS